jgi:hypothetical protein
MADTQADDRNFLQASSQFLSRLGRDPEFARQFDSDPVSALQEMFPELKKEPRERLQAVLDKDKETHEQLARLATSNKFSPVAGILSFLSSIINTRFIQGVAAAVAGALVARLVKVREPPVE